MAKKKIAIVTPVFPPYRGGIGAVAKNDALALAAEGHEVTVFTPWYEKMELAKYEGIEVQPLRPLFSFGNAAFVPQLLWRLNGFDCVYLHYPFIGGAELVILRKLFHRRTPLFVLYHMDLAGKGFKRAIFFLYQKICLPLLARLADSLRVTSRDYAASGRLKKYLARYSKKIVEIPLGVDIQRFAPRPKNADLSAALQTLPEEKTLLFVGGLDGAHYFKGLPVALAAFALLPPNIKARFLIVGDGNLRGKHESLAQNLKTTRNVVASPRLWRGRGDLDDLSAEASAKAEIASPPKAARNDVCVNFVGAVDDKLLPDYYNLADVVVFPSLDRSEAFGLVALEALASGKPVIASNLPGVRTLINEKNGLLVEPGNVKELSMAIIKILNEPRRIDFDSRYDSRNVAARVNEWLSF